MEETRLDKLKETIDDNQAKIGDRIHALLLLLRSRKAKEEIHEDQSPNDEELVEMEVGTEAIETEQGKEELIPQFQVHVSKLEHGLQIHNESPIVCEDSQDVVGWDELCEHQRSILQVSHVKARDVLVTKSTDVTNNQAAHYLFDKMPLRVQSKRRHVKCHKSWRFKFKHKVASRESKAGFKVNMKHNQSKEMLLQLLLSGTHKKRQRIWKKESLDVGITDAYSVLQDVFEMLKELLLKTSLVIQQVMRNKKIKFSKRWWFKYKDVDEGIKRLHAQLSYKCRWKLEEWFKIWSRRESGRKQKKTRQFTIKTKEEMEKDMKEADQKQQGDWGHYFLLFAAANQSHLWSAIYQVWHRWKARCLSLE